MDLEEHHDKAETEIQLFPLMKLTQVSKNRDDVSAALAWDDLAGMQLNADKVIEARSKEIQYVRDMGVWKKIPRRTAQARGWKVIKTRWIDINKGDDANPIYRSRIVGKSFNNEAMEGIFAGTPPLEALRAIIHEAATLRQGEDMRTKVIIVNDVSRAFFEAPAVRQVCVELPGKTSTAPTRWPIMLGISI